GRRSTPPGHGTGSAHPQRGNVPRLQTPKPQTARQTPHPTHRSQRVPHPHEATRRPATKSPHREGSFIHGPAATPALLPLDRRRRLPADVVHHPRDTPDLVDDPVRYPPQEIVTHVLPVRSSYIDDVHRLRRHPPIVSAPLA